MSGAGNPVTASRHGREKASARSASGIRTVKFDIAASRCNNRRTRRPRSIASTQGGHPNADTHHAMAFALFYVVAIIILVLHFTGWLARNNLEWLVLALAVAVFPAVLYL